MSIKEIIQSETLTEDEKIAALEEYVQQEAIAFNLFINKFGIRQEGLYADYLTAKAAREAKAKKEAAHDAT